MATPLINKDCIDTVLYHGHCSDGFGSAFIVWLYYKKLYGVDRANSIVYIPCNYLSEGEILEDNFLSEMEGKNILMVDFSYKYDQLLRLMKVAQTFKILDHHKTSKNDLDKIDADFKIFDLERSGVGITWDWFNEGKGEEIPFFLAMIQDRDLWRFSIPQTKKFIASFYEKKFDFDLWEKYLQREKVNETISEGKSWLSYQSLIINDIAKGSYCLLHLINKSLAIVSYVNTPLLKSEIGNKLLMKNPLADFSVGWNYRREKTYLSLRSSDDRFDVESVAKEFGAGGHRNASALVLDGLKEKLPYEIIPEMGLIKLLSGAIHGETKFKLKYTLFSVDSINPSWMEELYLDLIKRKNPDSKLIVFQSKTDKIDVDLDKLDIKIFYQYDIIFCEDNAKKGSFLGSMLQLKGIEGKILTFVSEKKFPEIFSEIDYEN